jgi:hypothetical protein
VFPALEKSEDIAKRAEADQIYLKIGKVSVDELRERDDQDPIGLGAYVALPNVTLVADLLDPPDPVVPIDPATGQPLQMPFGMTGAGAAVAQPKPGADGQPSSGEDPPPNGDDPVAKIAGELDAWSRKARRALRAGRPAERALLLRGPRAPTGSRRSRRPRRGDHRRRRPARLRAREGRCIRRPFRVELERELRDLWAATSVAWASGSPTGSASGRRPYP